MPKLKAYSFTTQKIQLNWTLILLGLINVVATTRLSRLLTVDFILFFLFYFILLLFLEQLGLGLISRAVTSVTRTDHRTWENKVEGSGIK